MTRTTSPSARLVQRLKAAFSNPPVKAGMRLNPERELARTLDVSPKCINRTLRLLTEEGILSKRHGSGNYIRRIPGECVPADLKAEQLFPASELEEDAAPHLASLPEQQRLTIQLWSGFHRNPGRNENYSLYRKIRSRIELAGHTLETCDIIDEHWEPLPLEQIAASLKAHPADGYLITSPLGGHFISAYRMAFGTEPTAAVYLSSWGDEEFNEPEIRLDGQEAVVRGIREFARHGLRKIAFLGIETTYHSGCADRQVYEFAMARARLDSRLSRHIQVQSEAARRAVCDMLDSPEPPEALFIGEDLLIEGVRRALAERGLIPGRDLAIITISHSEESSEIHPEWTSLDFNRDLTGVTAVNELLARLRTAGHEMRSAAMLGKWCFRNTHFICKGDANE